MGPNASCTASVQVNYSINFNQKPEDVEAVIIPVGDYDQWKPAAGGDWGTPRHGLALKGGVGKKKKPGQETKKKGQFKVELFYVSREPGVGLHWAPPKKT